MSKDTNTLQIIYPRCPRKDHEAGELKFILHNEAPDIRELYCSQCLLQKKDIPSRPESEPANLDYILTEVTKSSKKFSEDLQPVIDDFQRKQEQISRNDIKIMCDSLINKRENFRKVLQKFQKDVEVLSSSFEHLFDKKLESLLYESITLIESRLSSFRQTFEILRLKLTTYSTDITTFLNTYESPDQFKSNISTIFKDLNKLKDSRLIKLMKKTVNSRTTNSSIAEKFTQNNEAEQELTALTDKIITILSEKFTEFQHALKFTPQNMANNNLFQPAPVKFDPIQPIPPFSDNRRVEFPTFSANPGPLTAPKLFPEPREDLSSTREDIIRNEEPLRIDERSGSRWPDPSDESLELFEQEIKRCFIDEPAEFARPINFATLKINPEYAHRLNLKENREPPAKKTEPKDPKSQKDKDQEAEKLQKYANSLLQKAQNKSKNLNGQQAQKENEGESNSDEYISEEEIIDEFLLEREARRHFNSKMSLEPRIFKRIMKSKKPTPRNKGDKLLKTELAKFLIDKSSNTGKPDPATDDDILIVLNNGKVANDPVEFRKAFKEQLLQYLSVRDPSPETLTKVSELAKQIQVTYKNRRLSISTITQIEEGIGDFLRNTYSDQIISYRAERRKYLDRDSALGYEDVCREFLFKYYNQFKALKAALLKKLNLTNELYNESKKVWIEKGHTELIWISFKAKSQKTPPKTRDLTEEELNEILDEWLLLMKDNLEKFMSQFRNKTKREKHYFYELVSARAFDRLYRAYQVEEEDILCSLMLFDEVTNEENMRTYEEIENTIAKLVFPEYKLEIKEMSDEEEP